MPTFRLTGHITVSAYTEVEADTLAEAIERAQDREVVLHFVGSGTNADESWLVEEPDGEVNNVTGEEA